jgi:hypothetical protein
VAAPLSVVNPLKLVAEHEKGVRQFCPTKTLFEHAHELAPTLSLPSAVLDHLYANSHHNFMSRVRWEAEVRLATAVHTLLKTSRGIWFEAFDELLSEAAQNEIPVLTSSSGMLVVVFHGGFVTLLRRLFLSLSKDGVTIGTGGTYSAKSDTMFPLFAARRALLDGKSAFIGPDGPFGTARTAINVLGAHFPIADGAAFLAYETKCDTIWLNVVSSEDGFHAVTVPGPRRSDIPESFPDFRNRLYGFYAQQIEIAFTSAPRSVVLTGAWIKAFSRALAKN